MRSRMPLNFDWRFSPRFSSDCTATAFDDSGFVPVDIPHTTRELPLNYFDETVFAGKSCYRKTIDLPELLPGQRAILCFEGVSVSAEVYLNGTLVGSHRGAWTPFRIDITAQVKPGRNLLTVAVDSSEDPEVPPFGGVVDFLAFGGIYREVSLEIVNPNHIEGLFIRTAELDAHEKKVLVTARISGDLRGELLLSIRDDRKELASRRIAVSGEHFSTVVPVVNAHLWDIDSPRLYTLTLSFADGSDQVSARFGFRDARFTPDGFLLNGKPLKLRGLNRHQSYPYAGYAMSASAQKADADFLKNELGVNIVRTSHYPQSRHFLDRCDELGLLVFAEMPGWQHIGDGAWQKEALKNLEAMILRDRNHPAIVLWGVRINESPDSDDFYRAANEIAHETDSSRQTGGVRNFAGSTLLEDVYTYNDFCHDGGKLVLESRKKIARAEVPYLVSEHSGHMFPSKSFDDEEHRLEHALRHARVLNAMYGAKGIAGALGWCMSDYNTHRDFGSGDKICYHGVCDIFRQPKLAAAVYSSQTDGKAVFELSSTLDIGEHPAGRLGEIWAFTNCDCVKVFRDGKLVSTLLPDRAHFPHLPHPPMALEDTIGSLLEDEEGLRPKDARRVKALLRAVASQGLRLSPGWKLKGFLTMLKLGVGMDTLTAWYYRYVMGWGSERPVWRFEAWRSGRLEIGRTLSAVTSRNLDVVPDAMNLTPSETWDSVRVALVVRDQNGNRLPYASAAVSVEVSGPARVIGPAQFSLIGGTRAFWLRSTGGRLPAGSPPVPVVLTIRGEGLEKRTLSLSLTAPSP